MKENQRLNDEELTNRINATRAYIRRQNKREEDSKDAECDLCYLEREQEHRDIAQILHEKYIFILKKQKEQDELMQREEEEALKEHE